MTPTVFLKYPFTRTKQIQLKDSCSLSYHLGGQYYSLPLPQNPLLLPWPYCFSANYDTPYYMHLTDFYQFQLQIRHVLW